MEHNVGHQGSLPLHLAAHLEVVDRSSIIRYKLS